MNRYSLTFKDKKIEKEFQQHQNEQLLQSSTYIFYYLLAICAIMIGIRIKNNEYKLVLFPGAIIILLLFMVYQIKRAGSLIKYIPHALQSVSLLASLSPLYVYYNQGCHQYNGELLQNDLSMILALCFIKTSNFWRNLLSFLFFIVCRSSRHFFDGVNSLNFIFIFLCGLFIIYDYSTVQGQRKQYLNTKANQLQYDLLEKFCKEKILLAQYDKENMKFNTLLINQSLKETIDETNSNKILKDIIITEYKISLHTFIYQNFIQKQIKDNLQYQFKAKYGEHKQKIILDLMVYNVLEQTFVIRITNKLNQISNDSAALYKGLLVKLREKFKYSHIQIIVNRELVKNIISNFALIKQQKITYQIHRSLIYLDELLTNFLGTYTIQVKNYSNRQIYTDQLLLSSMIYLISKACKIKCIVIVNNEIKGVDVNVYGIAFKKLNRSNNCYYQTAIQQIHKLIGEGVVDSEINLISMIMKVQFNII